MSLRFRYQRIPVAHPIPSLDDARERPRPLIPVGLLGPDGQIAKDALLDPGADDTVLPEDIAEDIGVDLRRARQGTGQGVGGKRVPLRYAQVRLRLTDGREFLEWQGWVAFTSASLERPLLGYAGCLQYFTATFYGDGEEVRLTANRSYPGTQRRR